MLKWPERARKAIVGLFAPLQDLDVYIEDDGDEALYTELFRRITPQSVRIIRVFALGNRQKVLSAAKDYGAQERKALFVVDGDFYWVRGEEEDTFAHLYRWEAYCIENLLVDQAAVIQILMEENAITEDAATTVLGYDAWSNHVSDPLVDLFLAFAVAHRLNPTAATVGTALNAILTTARRGAPPSLDVRKVAVVIKRVTQETIAAASQEQVDQVLASVRARVVLLSRPVDIVSGKDFLLPLLDFHLQLVGRCRIERRSLRFRLTRHCTRDRFQGVVAAIRHAAGQ